MIALRTSSEEVHINFGRAMNLASDHHRENKQINKTKQTKNRKAGYNLPLFNISGMLEALARSKELFPCPLQLLFMVVVRCHIRFYQRLIHMDIPQYTFYFVFFSVIFKTKRLRNLNTVILYQKSPSGVT